MVENFNDYVGIHKGRSFMVVGAGGTIVEYSDKIQDFIKSKNLITIGVNKMTSFVTPVYHLWTNTGRLLEFGECISKASKLMLGGNLAKNIRAKFCNHILVDYVDSPKSKLGYRNRTITGHYRTAGCLSIMLAHLMGAKNIYVVGMDGYTLYSKEEVRSNRRNQHVYEKGFTDVKCDNEAKFERAWKVCIVKDKMVYNVLKKINGFGIKFNIITPTKFKRFYSSRL